MWICEENLNETEAHRKAEYQDWLENWIVYTNEEECE